MGQPAVLFIERVVLPDANPVRNLCIFLRLLAQLRRHLRVCGPQMHPRLDQTAFHQAPLLDLERGVQRQGVLPLNREAERGQNLPCRLDDFVLPIRRRIVYTREEEIRLPERETGHVTCRFGIGFFNRMQSSFRLWQIRTSRSAAEVRFEVLQDIKPPVQHVLLCILTMLADGARASEPPILQLLLCLLVCVTGLWDSVPEEDLRACRDVSGGAHDLHVADKAAFCIAVAAMIDMGGFDENAACMMRRRRGNRFGRVVFQRCARAAEAIESNDTLNEEAA